MKELDLLKVVMEKMSLISEPEEVLYVICDEAIKLFDVQRATITQFADITEEGFSTDVKMDYKKFPEIKGVEGLKYRSDVEKQLLTPLVTGEKQILAIDNIEKLETDYKVKESYKKIGVKSLLFALIKKDGAPWGFIVVSEYNNPRNWSKDEITLLNIVADQVSLVIKQAELYKTTKALSSQECLLRRIITAIRSTLDIKEIKHTIVNEVGKALKADAVVFGEFRKEDETYIVDEYSGYSTTPDLKNFVALDLSTYPGFQYLQNIHKQKKDVIYSDLDKFLDENDLRGTNTEKFFKDFNIQALFAICMIHQEQFFGNLVICYTAPKEFTDDELEFIKILASQAAIAVYQARLYESTKALADREYLLRSIMTTIKNTLDLNEIKARLVSEIGIGLHADRVLFTEYDQNSKRFLIIDKYSEYLSNPKLKSFVDFDLSGTSGFFNYIQKMHEQKKDFVYQNLDEYLEENNLKGSDTEKFLRDFNVQTLIAICIIYKDQFLGNLVLQYTTPKNIGDKELEFMRILASQTGGAMYQAKLYKSARELANRELILRNLIETLRSSLDLNEIKKIMTESIGKYLKADRCALSEYSDEKNVFEPISHEYLSPQEDMSIEGFNPSEGIPNIAQSLVETKEHIEPDEVEFMRKNNLVDTEDGKKILEQKVKSSYAIPILHLNELYGFIFVHYTKEKKYLTDEQLLLLRITANQAGVAFYQAKLYQSAKELADREYLLRSTLAAIRSTLDLKEIKIKIVNEVGKVLKADRVLFGEYIEKSKAYIIDEYSEYASSPDLKTFVNLDFSEYPGFQYIQSRHEQKTDIIYNDLDKFLDENDLRGTNTEKFCTDFEIKALLAICMIYQDEFLGNLVIHYKTPRNITDDEIEFIKVLASQSGIAIYQSRLYESAKKLADKEKLLREIVTEIKLYGSTDQVYKYILKKFAEVFDFKQTFFVEIPEFKSQPPVIKYQFDKISHSYKNQNIIFPQLFNEQLIELIKTQNKSLINNTENYYPKNKKLQDFFKKNEIKSFFISPITKFNEEKIVFGILVLCTDKVTNWTEYEIELFEEVLNTVSTVLWEISKREEIDKLRDTFILTLAHDLRVPLVGERRALEFIMSIPPGQLLDKYKYIIEETIKSNQTLSTFLTVLVDSYNYELGRKKLFITETDISRMIKEVISSLQNDASVKSIQLDMDIEENLPVLLIDKDEVKRVLYTILKNAITYTQENGHIIIKATKDKDFINTCVIDNGPGISEEIQKRLFKRYEMAFALERKIGSGMGLYLAKQIIETHNGKMEFTTKINEGTSFCFTLPV